MKMNHHQLPIALKIVAVLFIFGGIMDVLEMAVSLTRGQFIIKFGFLGLFIGNGLLALRPGWRTFALVTLWLSMIGIPIAVVFMFFYSGSLDLSFLGQKIGYVSKELRLAIAVLLFVLSAWEYRVLTSFDIRKLFQIETANQRLNADGLTPAD